MTSLTLPRQDGSLEEYRLAGTPIERPQTPPAFSRIAYAAAHVVSDPLRDLDPWGNPAIDWEATMAFRHHLWSLGFKIAEAMDTAQRGMGLAWPGAQQLIRRSLADARQVPGADLACGAGTDHLVPADARSLDGVIAAYEEQVGFVEGEGGRAIMMASRALARVARSADDYRHVYGRILGQTQHKVVLHWLGDMFDPQLKGYWGSEDFDQALDTVLSIIEANRDRIEGIKISLLDNAKEVALRNRLPEGVLCFTGDDFNYAELIEGDGTKYSHALLGIFDAVAPSASKALAALAGGDVKTFRGVIEPTVPLSRKIFEAPTQYYKAGVVFLAWLNGHQRHFTMPAGMQSARGVLHYSDIFRLADRANVLDRPELAVQRMQSLLSTLGIDQGA
ncbi:MULTISPECIES: dihydrodipicolinate synthase family protein [unclassified Ensifer]|uniref:dihydrodipicolinate synthase family protein n=1 Tax=unclassified Ensifer TaxID=2633371 RepID=UPI00081336AB|nr:MULTISPECIES: dihydrodipicolinate synthase family protein [unclassified Ensifer]OCP02226.1 dihydrodipicolinate synthase family protein [Ensifer sp. LC13]OCP02255.1 dihydrodipicolinate synthase family protein [Ensifer sp. LC11]OCP08237.1 dihydrodipicolinate synthase family protein [Ensifer sp. LC14]OCP29802.1 dihydrodipicolinate synthase family protein [Ensifer sp. LC499]